MQAYGNFLDEDTWHVGLDLDLIDPTNAMDLQTIAKVAAYLEHQRRPVEMFGCMFSYETIESFAFYVDRYAMRAVYGDEYN